MNSSMVATLSAFVSRWSALLFAVGVLLIGMAPGRLTFMLDPNAAIRIGLESVPVPAWVFTGVWLVVYPSMGIATWLIWHKRREQDVSVPLSIFGSILMTAGIDAIGLVLAYTVAWVYWRYQKVTIWWLLPWLVWMPITFMIKLWVLSGGTH